MSEHVTVGVDLVSRLATVEDELTRTTAALIDAYDQMLALYELVQGGAASLSRLEVVQQLARQACQVIGAHAVVVRDLGDAVAIAGDTSSAETLLDVIGTTGPVPSTLLRAVDTQSSDVLVKRFGPSYTGVLAVHAPPGLRLTTAQLKLVDAVANHGGQLLELAALHEAALETAIMERDVATAATLAAQVLPTRMPDIEGIDVSGRCDPARLASGDYFTFADIDDTLIVAVGDVSGKGLPAALMMTTVSTTTRSTALRLHRRSPAEVLQAISDDVYEYLDVTGMIVTTAIVKWQRGDDVIAVANAGHSPVFSVSANRASRSCDVTRVPPSSPPLGVLANLRSTVRLLPFRPGDMVVLGSDGLAEQEDASGALLGYDELERLLAHGGTTSSDDVVAQLFDAVECHGAGTAQSDDRTVVVLRRTAAGATVDEFVRRGGSDVVSA